MAPEFAYVAPTGNIEQKYLSVAATCHDPAARPLLKCRELLINTAAIAVAEAVTLQAQVLVMWPLQQVVHYEGLAAGSGFHRLLCSLAIIAGYRHIPHVVSVS